MEVFSKNSESLLPGAVATLRQKESAGLAIYICLSRLTVCKVLPATMDRMIALLKGHLRDDGNALYILQQGDAIVLLHPAAAFRASAIIGDLCLMFAEDPLAREAVRDYGNSFCMLFRSSEDMDVLHKLAVGMEELAASRMAEPGALYQVDREKFRAALRQRRERARICALIVEDQRFNLHLVIEILSRRFDILTATDGTAALKLYEEHAPDMVFLDIDLPGIDGFCVLEAITALDVDAFIVMLTASHMKNDVERAIQGKARGYIVKPFTRQKIEQYVTIHRKLFSNRGKASA